MSWKGEGEQGSLQKRKGKVGTERWREKGKRIESKRICLDRVSGKVFDVLFSVSEVASVSHFLGVFGVCVCCASVCACCDGSLLGCECGLWGCFLWFGLTFSFLSTENAKRVWFWSVRQRWILKDRPSKLCQRRSESGPRCNVRLSERYRNVCKAEHRFHQKGSLCKSDRHRQVHQRNHQRRERRRWRWKITILYCTRQGGFSAKWRIFLKRVKVSRWTSVSCSISCLGHKMQMSAARPSQKTRGMEEARASSSCSTRLEAKEQVEALKLLMQRVLPKQQGKWGDVKRHLQPGGGLHGTHSGIRGQTLPRRHQGRRQQSKLITHSYS